MRGGEHQSEGLFSYVRLEERIAADHSLRAVRALVDEMLAVLSSQQDGLYSHTERPSPDRFRAGPLSDDAQDGKAIADPDRLPARAAGGQAHAERGTRTRA